MREMKVRGYSLDEGQWIKLMEKCVNKEGELMEDRKELIKALKVIKQTCKSVTGKQCDDMYESGNCPIYDILGSCTLEDIPEDWYIEEHE